MASRIKIWIAGEILTAVDLNNEFDNILNFANNLESTILQNTADIAQAVDDITDLQGTVISSSGIARAFEYLTISTNTVIASGSTISFYEVDCSAGTVAITLPSAAAVTAGRFFEFKDSTGSATSNTISFVPDGADTIDNVATYLMTENFQCVRLTSDGTGNWMIGNQGNVVSEIPSVDNRIARYDGATGRIQVSPVNLLDTGDANGFETIDAENLQANNLLTGGATSATTANVFWKAVTRATGTTVGERGIAISAESGSVSETTTTPQDIGITATITTTGRPTFFVLTSDSSSGIVQVFADSSGNIFQGRVSIRRDGTVVASHEIAITLPTTALGGITVPPGSINGLSTQAAGTYDFDVTITSLNSDSTINVDDIKLIVWEL